jgi:N-acetylmuramoyl-L-alanine amidase
MNRNSWILCIVMTVVLGCLLVTGLQRTAEATSGLRTPPTVIVLDPGHGGIDGGAVSASGIVEKNINLSIALKLRQLLTLSGYTVIMTRETDCSIHNPSAKTVKEIKTSDIRNRLALMKQHGGIFVSIHQNSFTQSKYHGAQFFYAATPGSEALAECFRSTVCEQLQPENARATKPCTDDVYLIYHASTTAVLAECGFLSNPEEAAALSSEAYQQKMAFALYCGLIRFFQTNGG